jgi:hypothetical protein
MTRQIPQRDADALKTASHALVDKAGGVAKAAALTATSHSRLSEAASPWHDNRWLSLIHIADLECVAGDPVITRALADMAGYDLVPKAGGRAEDMHQHLAHIVTEMSDVSAQLSVAMTDGKMTAKEARQLKQEAQQAVERLQRFMTDCDRVCVAPASLAAVK